MSVAKWMRGLIPLAMAVGVGLTASPQAKAGILLEVSTNGTTFVTVTSSLTNFLIASGSAGGFSFVTDSAIANLPGSTEATLTSSVSAVSGPSGGDLFLRLTTFNSPPLAPGFTLPGVAGSTLVLKNELSTSGLDPLSSSSAFSTGLGGAGGTNSTTSTVSIVSPPTNNSGETFTTFVRGAVFELSNTTRITIPGANQSASFTTTSTATAVPEPATMAMAAFGLPMLAVGAWRRRRNATKA